MWTVVSTLVWSRRIAYYRDLQVVDCWAGGYSQVDSSDTTASKLLTLSGPVGCRARATSMWQRSVLRARDSEGGSGLWSEENLFDCWRGCFGRDSVIWCSTVVAVTSCGMLQWSWYQLRGSRFWCTRAWYTFTANAIYITKVAHLFDHPISMLKGPFR